MASSERPEALVDAATSQARRASQLTKLAKRTGRFALAYSAFEIAFVVVCTVLVLAPKRGVYGGVVLQTVFFVSALSVPLAWLPLSSAIHLALKARIAPIAASLLAGTIAGSALALLLAIYSAWLGTLSFDTSPPANPSFSLVVVVEQFLEILKTFAPGGASGGFLFWAVYFGRPTRMRVPTAPLQDA